MRNNYWVLSEGSQSIGRGVKPLLYRIPTVRSGSLAVINEGKAGLGTSRRRERPVPTLCAHSIVPCKQRLSGRKQSISRHRPMRRMRPLPSKTKYSIVDPRITWVRLGSRNTEALLGGNSNTELTFFSAQSAGLSWSSCLICVR